jgi:branched-chain amino acid transport system ATP-binding protein
MGMSGIDMSGDGKGAVAATPVGTSISSSGVPSPAGSAASGPMLVVKSVNVVYGGVIEVLDGVSLEVGSGQVVAILGANGAGKTTLLRAVSGLLAFQNGAITAGSVELFGADVTKSDAASRVRSGMAQVMEGRRIFSELTVDENLKVGAYSRKDKAEITVSYDRVMTLFPRLAERRKQIAGYMSGGEQQMVAMGRALMANPRLLLLDEPSLGLAPLIVEQIRDIVVEINKQGTSVLIVEQNASMALSISNYGYVMETGTVAKHGPGSVLLNDPEIKALYLGGESEHTSFHDLKSYRASREYVG